ncbi:MAG TPA: hypothetical protein VMV92_28245 [Streptosporangiaceae bacterium]|nr:hypothetical protein [Streptosporangiaceae bacterium]
MTERDLADGQHRNPDPVGTPEFFRNGRTRNGASRSCSPRGQWKRNPR